MYVEPRTEYDADADALSVHCWACGDEMTPEVGERVGGPEKRPQWLWYRCSGNPRHVSHALPLPARMAT